MPNIALLLIYSQVIGAVVGVVSVVAGELRYIRALRDGRIDAGERAQIESIGYGLKYGMTLLLVGTGGLVYVAYFLKSAQQPALSSGYWMLMGVALLIITISSRIARRDIRFGMGTAILFTSWWFLSFLSLGWLTLTIGSAIASLLVTTVVFYGILSYIRLLSARQ